MRSTFVKQSSAGTLGRSRVLAALVAAAFALPLGAGPVGAQAVVGSSSDTAAGREARVRITLKDDSLLLGQYSLRPSFSRRLEGRLVALRRASVDMRLDNGDTITFPVSSVVRLDQYGGQGSCRSSDGGEALCLIGGLVGGAFLGAWAGDKVARQMNYSYKGRQQWRWRGGVVGGLFTMTIVLPVMGRDRWVPIPNWP